MDRIEDDVVKFVPGKTRWWSRGSTSIINTFTGVAVYKKLNKGNEMEYSY